MALLIPLLCAILYPLGTLLMKRALDRGVDLWGSMAVNYWAMALVFLPAAAFGRAPIPWGSWYQPMIMGMLSFAGQGCAIKAVSEGDLTIATPALGAKVLMVAVLTEVLLREHVPLSWWIAAALSFAAVVFLQTGAPSHRRSVTRTLLFSLLAAGFFALGDVLIQKWAPAWGAFHFLPAMAASAALCSLGLFPFMRGPRFAYDGATWAWLWSGTLVLGLQSLMLTAVIAVFGKVTLVNVVFSSRGLWNFLLIWFAGHWFSNREREAGSRVMAQRLMGAALMFAAIVLVSLRR